jgi:thiol:disulfide interchange protein DsbD
MMNLTIPRGLSGALLALSLLNPALAEDNFLEPAQAFKPSASITEGRTAQLSFAIAPGYYLYRERTEISGLEGTRLDASSVQLPDGQTKFDPNFGKEMVVWKQQATLRWTVAPGQTQARYAVRYQGCAEQGLCYPPQTGELRVSTGASGELQAQWLEDDGSLPSSTTLAAPTTAATADNTSGKGSPSLKETQADDVSGIVAALHSGQWLWVVGLFFVFGLGLSFTPCVLPMMPILSSIIVGQSGTVSRSRGFLLALSYSMGMACIYTLMGVAAGLAGAGLAAALQNPWVLGAFALLLSALALSMFGVWEFQMPAAVQTRLQGAASRLPGGQHVAVFAMGGLSALMVGPCVAAPLAGALVYIGQTRDAALGAVALFSLAMGMSIPLLALGLSAGTLLPRAGPWMERVKTVFGVLLMGVALWLVAPVLPEAVVMLLLGGGLLVGAVSAFRSTVVAKGLALVAGLWGASLVIGALSGGSTYLQPLRHLAERGSTAAVASTTTQAAGPRFERVKDMAALNAALSAARQRGQTVILDFYADWCTSCKEMEHLTFAKPEVQARMGKALLLQADVTANNADDRALLRHFTLFGPPAVLLFDAQGQEKAQARIIGFMPPEKFLSRLAQVGL